MNAQKISLYSKMGILTPPTEEVPAVPEEVPAVPEEVPAVPEEVPAVPEEVPVVPEEVPAVPEEEEEEDVPVARSAALIEEALNATVSSKLF
jgi:hypothetical protein